MPKSQGFGGRFLALLYITPKKIDSVVGERTLKDLIEDEEDDQEGASTSWLSDWLHWLSDWLHLIFTRFLKKIKDR